jgi:hypothetical protein
MSLSVEWLWRFFVESLSHLFMIKFVEQLQMGKCNYIQSNDVFFLLTVFLLAWSRLKLETLVCFAQPDQGYD